jgi:hypothetical protein
MFIRAYLQKRGIFYYAVQNFRSLSVPAPVKFIVMIVLIGNVLAISLGMQRYPFYDVGMYRWPVEYRNRDKMVKEVKYYYNTPGGYEILELRKESSFLLADHFGFGFSNDIAYATTYFHKAEKENFEFLSREMKKRGVDTLWAGVHAYNFETNEAAFDPDICRAIKINLTEELYKGPIYIPDYQLHKCDEQELY